MGLTKSSEIPRMDLGFDRNNFVAAKIIHGSFRFKKIIFVLFDLIFIVDKWKMIIILHFLH